MQQFRIIFANCISQLDKINNMTSKIIYEVTGTTGAYNLYIVTSLSIIYLHYCGKKVNRDLISLKKIMLTVTGMRF